MQPSTKVKSRDMCELGSKDRKAGELALIVIQKPKTKNPSKLSWSGLNSCEIEDNTSLHVT